MAPRNTQTGASATSRRVTDSGGRVRSSASSRTPVERTRAARPASNKSGGTVVPFRSPKASSTPPRAEREASSQTCEAPSAARWWVVPLAVVTIIAAFVLAYYPVAQVQYRESRERARLEAELAALKARNQRLSTEVARLQTPEGVEDYARTQLGLVKRGEHVVVVRTGDGSVLSTSAPAVPEVDSDYMADEPVGPWTGLLDLVFGVR